MIKRWLILSVLCLGICSGAQAAPPGPTFEVTFPAAAHSEAVTGRVFLMISRVNEPEVRLQVGWVTTPPVFGVDVISLKPGRAAVVDAATVGFPLRSLKELPAGDYYVQALLNVYTEFHRADGHVIWAHADQWEGQQLNISPGNLYSPVQKIHLDGARGGTVKLSLSEVIPPIALAADTPWVKHVKFQSKLLTKFWGRPVYLGAVILLPRDYETHPGQHYPVIYAQGHFSQEAAFGFRTEDLPETPEMRQAREAVGIESGYQFYQSWKSDRFPRMIAVTFQHPTPYYDDSYAVDSANNGPYGQAVMTELIPYLEKSFRISSEPYARVLTGGSTGGWESLALQLYHPKFFGGAWVFYPDPIDFRRYDLVNVYDEENAFIEEEKSTPAWQNFQWQPPERSFMRAANGQPLVAVRRLGELEAVMGSSRSTGVFANWEAVYGPVGEDGYPKPLWDKTTGKIDRGVAHYMREHNFDLRDYAERNWSKIGPDLVGKLHFYCGDMDNFYLNLSVYLMEDFLKSTKEPYYAGSFEYGRPMKGHGWQPMTNADLVRLMAAHIARHKP